MSNYYEEMKAKECQFNNIVRKCTFTQLVKSILASICASPLQREEVFLKLASHDNTQDRLLTPLINEEDKLYVRLN